MSKIATFTATLRRATLEAGVIDPSAFYLGDTESGLKSLVGTITEADGITVVSGGQRKDISLSYYYITAVLLMTEAEAKPIAQRILKCSQDMLAKKITSPVIDIVFNFPIKHIGTPTDSINPNDGERSRSLIFQNWIDGLVAIEQGTNNTLDASILEQELTDAATVTGQRGLAALQRSRTRFSTDASPLAARTRVGDLV